MQSRFFNISPQYFYLYASLLIGLFYNLLVPPFQVPDEHDHFRRVYHLASGHFLPEKKGNRLGGDIPVSFKEYVHPFRLTATNLKYTLNEEHYAKARTIELAKDVNEFNDFPNSSNYSLISYLPQTLTVFLFKSFDSPWWLIYSAGRVFTYLFWVMIMFLLIKIIPIYKWLFTFILLLPSHIFISHSFSADTMTNLLAITFLVLCLKYAFDKQIFTTKRLLILLLIGAGLALSKIVYVGMIFLFFLVPATAFKNRKQRFIMAGALILFSFTIALLWSAQVKSNMISYSDYDPAYKDFCCISHCADFAAQKDLILSKPLYFPKVVWNSLFRHPYTYLVGYIGNFGNNDVPLPRSVFYLIYLFIVILALSEKNNFVFTAKQKLLLAFTSLGTFVLLLLSQHLAWDCVGEGIVDIVQGRYLIPLFPLLFFSFKISRFPVLRSAMVPIFIVFILVQIVSCVLIYDRYTRETFSSKIEWDCNVEKEQSNLLGTSVSSINVEGAGCKSDSISFKGKYSAKLSPASPYCFTYRFNGLSRGDLLEISAWQKGEGAQVILSGKGIGCKEFYIPNHTIAYENKNGWKRMHYAFTFNESCSPKDSVNATFFLWNPGNAISFIDELHFSLKKYPKNYIDQRTTLF